MNPKIAVFFKIWPSVEFTKIHIVMHNFIITFDMNDTRVDFFISHPGKSIHIHYQKSSSGAL